MSPASLILVKPLRAPLTLGLMVIITMIVYWNGLDGQMIFDDIPNIATNDWLQINELTLDSVNQAWHSGTSSEIGRPLTMLSFALNHWWHGLTPWGYKFINLMLHLINGLLIVWLLNGLIRTPALDNHSPKQITSENARPRWLTLLPYAVAGAWLLNPINVTSVLYIVQRMAELATLFTFIGMASYVQLRLKINACNSSKQRLRLGLLTGLLIPLLTLIAIFGKETGALLPLYLLIIEWIFFKFRFPSKADQQGFIAGFIIFCGIPTLIVAYTLLFNFDVVTEGYIRRNFTLEQRLLTEPRAIGAYLGMMVAPVSSDFGLYHDDFLISSNLFTPIDTLLWSVSLVMVLFIALLSTRKNPLISFGILFFFASHSIESTVINLELMHEHRNYPGSMGIMLSLFSLLLNNNNWPDSKRIRQGLAIAFIVLFATSTHLRANTWSNLVGHAFSMYQNHPDSARSALGATQILAQAYRHDPHKHAALLLMAQTALKRAKAKDPGNPNLESAVILLHWFAKQPVPDEQLKTLINALEKRSHSASTSSILSVLIRCRKQDDCPIDHETMTELFQVSVYNPVLKSSQRAHIASLISRYAMEVMGNRDIGVKHQQLAIEFDPGQPRHVLNLVRSYISLNEFNNAQELLNSYSTTPSASHSQVIIHKLQTAINQRRKSMQAQSPTPNTTNTTNND